MLNTNDRLVHEHANGWYSSTGKPGARYWTNATKAQLMERLGEYEDTGYTPEEIRSVVKALKEFTGGAS
jgi:hypothetical protein